MAEDDIGVEILNRTLKRFICAVNQENSSEMLQFYAKQGTKSTDNWTKLVRKWNSSDTKHIFWYNFFSNFSRYKILPQILSIKNNKERGYTI